MDPNILLASTRSQAKKAKTENSVLSCSDNEQYWACRRLFNLVLHKATEYNIPMDDTKLAKKIAQRVSVTERANVITVGKKFSKGLQAARKEHGAELNGLEPDFDSGKFDTEVQNTRSPDIKGPYWTFIKNALHNQELKDAQVEAAKAEEQLVHMLAPKADSPDEDADLANAESLPLLHKRLSGPYLLTLRAAWWKMLPKWKEAVEKGKEMWVDRLDRLSPLASDEAPVETFHLTAKGTDPLTKAMGNTIFLDMLIAAPCVLLIDLDLAPFEPEHVAKGVELFGQRGIVLVMHIGTREEQASMLAKEAALLSKLTLGVACTRVWLQMDAEEPGPGIQASSSSQKQTGSVLVLSTNEDDNVLAKRVSGLSLMICF